MFSHVHIGSNDTARAKRFYDALIGALGGGEGAKDPDRDRYFYSHDGALLIVGAPLDEKEATVSNGSTIGFRVDSPEQGAAWVRAGLDHGGTLIEDAPGIRDRGARGQIYLAYLRDPDGHKLCAMKFMEPK
ncbi:VOC family protein [Croceicoccus sp. Ery15]|uniref:VOC family protein n=1 Tax=Croceicoccus sp. Ery15 TaxID=1703338 RepID=UPI001E340D9E|nr:VOC family protein [Croceicoccus sp. Ery15]